MNSDSISDSGASVLGFNTFIYCANNPVNASDPSGHGVIWNWIKSLFGFETKKSTTIKSTTYATGNKHFVEHTAGVTTTTTDGTSSEKSIVAYSNIDNSNGESSYQAGIGTQSADFSVGISNDSMSASFSCDSKYISGAIDISVSDVYTTYTFTSYTSISDDTTIGYFDSYQVNRITTQLVAGAAVATVVFFPEVAVYIGGILAGDSSLVPA